MCVSSLSLAHTLSLSSLSQKFQVGNVNKLDAESLAVNVNSQLGQPGGSADVFNGTIKLRRATAPEAVAVKVFRGSNNITQDQLDTILKEASIGFRVGVHPNLTYSYGYTVKPSVGMCIVMEVMGGGHLHSALSVVNAEFPSLSVRLDWLIGVASGMWTLHSFKPPIIHNDLKSLNVLLSVSRHPSTMCAVTLRSQRVSVVCE